MLTTQQNPPIQMPEGQPIEAFEGRWWVAHVKPRQEKALAWDAVRSGGAYFLPMYETSRRSRGRTWKSILPLFPGYVFLCGTHEERLRIMATQRIANVIHVNDQRRIIGELSNIQRMLLSGAKIDPYPGLKKGSRCRIRSGPLAGLEGWVECRKGRARFIVEINVLGQAAAVEIDAELLESVE